MSIVQVVAQPSSCGFRQRQFETILPLTPSGSAANLEPRPEYDRGTTAHAALVLRGRVDVLIDLDCNHFTAAHKVIDVSWLQ